MTIQEAYRAVINHKSSKNSALIPVTTAHSSFDGNLGSIGNVGFLGTLNEDEALEL